MADANDLAEVAKLKAGAAGSVPAGQANGPKAETEGPAVQETAPEAGEGPKAEDAGDMPGVIVALADMAAGALVTETGLAGIFGKCTASIRAAVDRGELPRPVRLMGKPTWTAGSIVRWHEDRLAAEAKKFARLRPSA